MTTEPRTFPPRPLRDVKAAYIRQASCPSSVAITVSDFEPWEQGVEFEVADTSTVPGSSRPPKRPPPGSARPAGGRTGSAGRPYRVRVPRPDRPSGPP
ncbi:hypothetical protein DBP21_33230 [Streptomyces sp. CS147]|nr:hypothetical protein DBP21_33230 [Streptomyces sp. CS147]